VRLAEVLAELRPVKMALGRRTAAGIAAVGLGEALARRLADGDAN
jgi:hypothetical protein